MTNHLPSDARSRFRRTKTNTLKGLGSRLLLALLALNVLLFPNTNICRVQTLVRISALGLSLSHSGESAAAAVDDCCAAMPATPVNRSNSSDDGTVISAGADGQAMLEAEAGDPSRGPCSPESCKHCPAGCCQGIDGVVDAEALPSIIEACSELILQEIERAPSRAPAGVFHPPRS